MSVGPPAHRYQQLSQEARVSKSWWQVEKMYTSPRQLQHHSSVSLIFRSLGIILYTVAWEELDYPCFSETGKTPVFLFLTGVAWQDAGLSAPITFDSIEDKIQAVLQLGPNKTVQTTIETAVDFVMDLERREASRSANVPVSTATSLEQADYPKPEIPEIYKHHFDESRE